MPDMMKCPSCGALNPTGPSNCVSCGTPLRHGTRVYLDPSQLDQATRQPFVPPPVPTTEILPGQMKRCPFCAEEVQGEAIVCKHCGRQIAKGVVPLKAGEVAAPIVVANAPSNGVAAVLSLFIPGAGQMYKGSVGMGIAWLISVVIGYAALIFPGLILHVFCIVHAASMSPDQASAAPMIQCVDCKHVAVRGPAACPQCGHLYGSAPAIPVATT